MFKDVRLKRKKISEKLTRLSDVNLLNFLFFAIVSRHLHFFFFAVRLTKEDEHLLKSWNMNIFVGDILLSKIIKLLNHL